MLVTFYKYLRHPFGWMDWLSCQWDWMDTYPCFEILSSVILTWFNKCLMHRWQQSATWHGMVVAGVILRGCGWQVSGRCLTDDFHRWFSPTIFRWCGWQVSGRCLTARGKRLKGKLPPSTSVECSDQNVVVFISWCYSISNTYDKVSFELKKVCHRPKH